MLILESDGGCEPNPGPARIGVVAKREGRVVWRHAAFIGRATNNVAEWSALLKALDYAIGATMFAAEPVTFRLDSQLVQRQLIGRWRTKDAKLKPLCELGQACVRALEAQGVRVAVIWVPREQNTEADALTR